MKNLFSKKMVAAVVMGLGMSFAGMCHAETVTLDLASSDSVMQIEVNGVKYTLTREVAVAPVEAALVNTVAPVEQTEVKTSENTQATVATPVVVREPEVTGVIIDASGLGLETTFSPAIYSSDGQSVYGAKNLNVGIAISKGMVEYASSVEAAKASARVGAKPMVLKAVGVRGGANSVNNVNVVISNEDATKVLLANEVDNMFGECAVVFVR